VVETYQLNRSPVMASNRLKRERFPGRIAGMLGIVAVIALGGAADPASCNPTQAWTIGI
jgi:hypothetical protein